MPAQVARSAASRVEARPPGPRLLKPMRLITARSSASRNSRGCGLPACGRGVSVPTSTKPKPSRASARAPRRPCRSPRRARPGLGKSSPATVVDSIGISAGGHPRRQQLQRRDRRAMRPSPRRARRRTGGGAGRGAQAPIVIASAEPKHSWRCRSKATAGSSSGVTNDASVDFARSDALNRTESSELDMRLTHLADYAVVMMTAAARHPGGRAAQRDRACRGDRRAAADRAEADRPARRGRPARPARAAPAAASRWRGRRREISLADIVEAVEGPIAMTGCSSTATTTARSTRTAGSSRTWAWSAMRCAARSARCRCSSSVPRRRRGPAGHKLARLAGASHERGRQEPRAQGQDRPGLRMGLRRPTSSRSSRPRA